MAPFAGFKDFQQCLKVQQRKGYPLKVAQRICGSIKHKVEDSKKLGEGYNMDRDISEDGFKGEVTREDIAYEPKRKKVFDERGDVEPEVIVHGTERGR